MPSCHAKLQHLVFHTRFFPKTPNLPTSPRSPTSTVGFPRCDESERESIKELQVGRGVKLDAVKFIQHGGCMMLCLWWLMVVVVVVVDDSATAHTTGKIIKLPHI